MSSFGDIMRSILRGEKSDKDIQDFLIGLNEAGLTSEQVRIGVEIMRENMTPVDIPNAIDIVGTGGTGLHTLSISTASALVCAGAGARVAKHGNRAASSLTGTADTLSELGVNQCVDKAGVGFLFAPNHHPAMRFVGPARKAIGKATIFNLLGPMCNPAGTKRMLVGVRKTSWRKIMAPAFSNLGVERVWLVRGRDGLDEITTTTSTGVTMIEGKEIKSGTLPHKRYGFPAATIEDLRGGTPKYNANALTKLLDGEKGHYRNIVLKNSGAAIYIAGLTKDIYTGIDLAAQSIDSGKARAALGTLIEVSNG